MEEYGNQGAFILCPVLVSETGTSVLTGKDDCFPALFDERGECRGL